MSPSFSARVMALDNCYSFIKFPQIFQATTISAIAAEDQMSACAVPAAASTEIVATSSSCFQRASGFPPLLELRQAANVKRDVMSRRRMSFFSCRQTSLKDLWGGHVG